MNKKIVFSLALLSAFSYVSADTRTSLRIGIAQGDSEIQDEQHLAKCLYTKHIDGLNDCAKLRKMNDTFYVQCVSDKLDITHNSGYFHLVNILNQKGDTTKHPEKVRYHALRECDISYYDSRMYAAYKMLLKAEDNKTASDFVESYKKIIDKKIKSSSGVCKTALETERDYINFNGSLDEFIGFDGYYGAIGYKPADIVDVSMKKSFSKHVYLQSDLDQQYERIIQDYYKEFTTQTTGRVLVKSAPVHKDNQYMVYLLDQTDFRNMVNKNNENVGYAYKNFSNIIGDWSVSNLSLNKKDDHNHYSGIGCTDITTPSLKPQEVSSYDINKLIFIDETYKMSKDYFGKSTGVVLGVCDVYNAYFNKTKGVTSNLTDRAIEALILKNSKIKPYDWYDFMSDYNDWGKKTKLRTNDYQGGISKCYNYDLEHYTSDFSRAKYFDYNNKDDYRKDIASEIRFNNYGFSIHKDKNRKGIYFNDGETYNFSVNVRPSFKTNKQLDYKGDKKPITKTEVDLKVDFIPDANYYVITNKANGESIANKANGENKDQKIVLRVDNLNDVYIALNNSYAKFDKNDRDSNSKYSLTKYNITKTKISGDEGLIPEGNRVKEKIATKKLKLEVVQDIQGFGLSFSKDAFMQLVNIEQADIEKGYVYDITLEPLEIMEEINEKYYDDVYKNNVGRYTELVQTYERPMFQVSGEDIITGSPKGNITIRLGKNEMPKGTVLGSAYNIIESDKDKVTDGKYVLNGTEVAPKIYTRTNKQNIKLGFTKPNIATLNKQYIQFLDSEGNKLNAKVFDSTKKIFEETGEKTCKGYYPIDNKMIIELDKYLNVGQNYYFTYQIAEYEDSTEECVVLGKKQSNYFSIRPESVEYEVNGKDSFDKKAGKTDDNYTDNNVIINSDIKDDRFGVGIAELRVNDSKNKEYVFNLEDKNTTQLNDPKNKTFVDFDKDGNFVIKTIFPMVTDAKIALAESKFTINDYENGLCEDTKRAVSVSEANKINKNGKIYCQTPGNELSVNFIADEKLGLEKDNNENAISPYLTNQNFVNYVPFSDKDSERLAIPLQITSKNASEYFYKKFSDNEAKLLLDLKYSKVPNLNKMIVKVDPANTTLDITATSKIGEFSINNLNKTFDEKLVELKGIKLSDYDEINFDAKDFGKINFKIGYLKNTGTKPNLDPVFKIIGANAKVEFKNSKPLEYPNILSNSYEFAYTGMFFKDLNKNTGKSREIKPDDAWVFKYDNNKFVKVPNANINDFKKLFNGAKGDFIFTSDYSRNAFKGNTYNIPSNVSNNQYFKDTLRFRIDPSNNNSYLDSNASFTIEFIK